MQPTGGLWAATVGAAGVVFASGSSLIAQVQTDPTGAGAWISGASSLSAVGALVYIARQFGNGSLVARGPAEAEKRLAEISERLSELVASAHRREELLIEEMRRRET